MRTSVINVLEDVLDGENFAALVVTALRADAVRHLRLMALRAGRQRLRLEEVVRATRARACLRMAAFWVRHGAISLNVFLLGQLFPDPLQRAPPVIDDRRLALALLAIAVRAAIRTEAETVFLA